MSPEREAELVEQVPLAGMRAVIARRMTESLREMAQLTLHRRVETGPLERRRAALPPETRPSVNDLMLEAVASVLPKHPSLNATLEESTIHRWRTVHLGIAVSVDDGLVVPVIRNADRLSLAELRAEAARLGRVARAGELTMAEIQGATFTVSNLGSFGIDAFTPIINPPQVAILGVGRIDRGSMTLSLTIDHRALDGVPAARFLDDVAKELEAPEASF